MFGQAGHTGSFITWVWARRLVIARLASQNNYGVSQGGYDFNADNGFVHIALMGDPTLRMHMVAPPSALLVSSNGSGGASVSWNASPDTVLGYYVYSAPMAAGPFTRLTSSLLTVTNYTDPVVSTNVYMVRAVKLEVSGSGSYSNASQGIFQSLDGTAGAPGMNSVSTDQHHRLWRMARHPNLRRHI